MNRPMIIDILRKLPANEEEVVKNKFIPLIKSIESDIVYELLSLSEYNKQWYKGSYEQLLKEYMNIDKLIKTKRNISFSVLCELYNNLLEEYKCFREILCSENKDNECEYLNRRIGWYKLKLDFIKDIFEIEYKESR